jgi:hypothetical protein
VCKETKCERKLREFVYARERNCVCACVCVYVRVCLSKYVREGVSSKRERKRMGMMSLKSG